MKILDYLSIRSVLSSSVGAFWMLEAQHSPPNSSWLREELPLRIPRPFAVFGVFVASSGAPATRCHFNYVQCRVKLRRQPAKLPQRCWTQRSQNTERW